MECWTCASITGEKRISPGPTIYEGRYWLVEHAYPSQLKGWLVIVLKRHAEALHDLSHKEFEELADIQARVTRVLFDELKCEKEYVACFAEKEHFHHIHFHLVARPADWPDHLKGTKIFAMINVEESQAVPGDEIRVFCEQLRDRFKQFSHGSA